MRELLRGVAALAMLAFIAYPAITHAPTEYRILPVISLRPSATIIFGGDMMFDRTIRKAMDENGEDYIFSCIDDVLNGADLVVANLEGPITEYPSKSHGSIIG